MAGENNLDIARDYTPIAGTLPGMPNARGAPLIVKSIAVNGDGSSQSALPAGRALAAQSVPVALSSEDNAALLPARNGVNRSTSSGTAAAVAMPANLNRRGWKIKNDSTVDVWINFTTSATASAGGGNMKVAANGGYLASEPSFVETGAMSIISTAAAAVTIMEF